MRPRLRLFTGEAELSVEPSPPITVRLGDVTRILRDAVATDRTWIADFEDDEIQVSADLYEVLCAYWQLRPSA